MQHGGSSMKMPPLINRSRAAGLLYVTLWTLLQGGAAGGAAFAVRGLFEAMHRQQQTLPIGMLAMLGASGAVIALSRVASGVVGERIGQDYVLAVRHALFRHAARMPASDVAMRRNGYMSLRFVGDMSAMRGWVGTGLPHLIAAVILIPIAQWVLWSLHPALGRAVLPFFIFGFAAIGLGGFFLVPLHSTLRQRRARIAADMVERMPLAPELGRMARVETEAEQITRHSHSMIEVALLSKRLSEGLKALPDILAALAALTVIWVGYRQNVSTGTIAGALSALGIAFFPMRELASVWDLLAGFRAAYTKCANALNRRRRPGARTRRKKATGAYSLEVENLSAGSLQDFSIRIDAGATVTLQNMPPHQKKHFFSVLAGLEIIENGTVRFSGTPLAETDQRRVLVVGAHPPVLRGSLRRALTLGLSPRPKDEAIQAIAQKTGFSATLDRLGGLDARIAEGGKNLSVLEGAQLSLTRAMLCKAPGLVLINRTAQVLDAPAQQEMMAWIQQTEVTALFAERHYLPH